MPELIRLCPDNLDQANWLQAGQNTLPVLSVVQIRQLEVAAFERVDSFLLMHAAGLRSARKIAEIHHNSSQKLPPCLVLAGPGNNGGDAIVVASELHQLGFEVELLQVSGKQGASNDRGRACQLAADCGLNVREFTGELPEIHPETLVIDGLLGIACDRAPVGLIASLIQHVNHNRPARVYSLDCPSGLNCDTGEAEGAAIHADTTFTYLALKHGLMTNHGKHLAGEVWLEQLDCDELQGMLFPDQNTTAVAHAVAHHEQLRRLPTRGHEHHKGSFGGVAVIGGQSGMTGACVLSARTALLLGCGRVALSLLAEQGMHMPDIQQQGQHLYLDPLFPEIMNKALDENLAFADTAVIGPGLGQTDEALHLLFRVLEHGQALNMVWDADALNLLTTHDQLRKALQAYREAHPNAALVLTPHPLEAARLLGGTVSQVQGDRPRAALQLAQLFQCTAVLKGSGTLVCNTTRMELNLTGGPALGTAGSGDVLAGAIAAMLGQRLSEFDAAALAVYLHGSSVHALEHEAHGLQVSTASEISQRMKQRLNSLLQQSTRRNR